MRASPWSWWIFVLATLVFTGWGAGCTPSRFDRDRSGPAPVEETDDDPLPSTSADQAECPGNCVAEPPAPFNSKVHLVWFGAAATPPDCPEIAPLPGMLAHIVSIDMDGQPGRAAGPWVRECLISDDAESCDQGTTCAPLPPEDYELCISRELDGPCPDDYYPRHVVAQEQGEPPASPLTLCCTHQKFR